MAVSKQERRADLLAQGLKYCPKCKGTMPLTEFARDRQRTDGLASWCRACAADNGRLWHAKAMRDDTWLLQHRVRDCEAHKRAYVYHPIPKATEAQTRDRLARRRNYQESWNLANSERLNAYYSLYRQRHPERRAIEQARAAQRYQIDPDYREARIAISQARRARQHNALYTLSKEDIGQLRRLPCLFCGSREHLTIAHDVPVAAGGNTTRANVFVLCRSCNSRMGTRTLAEVLRQQAFL